MAMRGRGFVQVPIGAYAPTYRPGSKRRKQEAERESIRQSKANGDAIMDKLMRQMGASCGVAEEDMDLFVKDPNAYGELIQQRKAQARAIEKLADREARIAVEGDTDTNHDNLEG